MPAAVQTTVLDVLKSAQNAADGTLNVNASLAISTVKIEDTAGNSLTSTGGALDVNLKTPATVAISAVALPLPALAATSTKQPALGTAGSASADVLSVQGVASMTPLKVDGSGFTQPVSGTVTVQQSTASSLKVDLSGTAANTTAIKVDGSGVTQPVSGTVSTNPVGYTNAAFVRNDYTSVSVTTSAYTQLIASTANTYQQLFIFDSSGQTLKLAIGAAASEVDKIIIPPGGFGGPMAFNIPSGSRVSIKAISASASVGEIDIQLLG